MLRPRYLWHLGLDSQVPSIKAHASYMWQIGLFCSMGYGIFGDQAKNSYLLHRQVETFTTEPPGKAYFDF